MSSRLSGTVDANRFYPLHCAVRQSKLRFTRDVVQHWRFYLLFTTLCPARHLPHEEGDRVGTCLQFQISYSGYR